jgi:hypothetical protein
MAAGRIFRFPDRRGDVHSPGKLGFPGGSFMSVILVFLVFVVIGDAIAVGISSIVEQFSQPASLLVFLGLFVLVFWIGWILAVRVTERYIIRTEA